MARYIEGSLCRKLRPKGFADLEQKWLSYREIVSSCCFVFFVFVFFCFLFCCCFYCFFFWCDGALMSLWSYSTLFLKREWQISVEFSNKRRNKALDWKLLHLITFTTESPKRQRSLHNQWETQRMKEICKCVDSVSIGI